MPHSLIFDHMFLMPLPILEKLLRPVIVYLVLVLLLRLFGKRELAQLNPFDLVVDAVQDFAGKLDYREELQIDGAAVTVVMADMRDSRADGGADAELLIQFAGQGLLRAFAGFDLAARKLPEQGHRLIRAALTDQDLAVMHDERGRHETKGGSAGPGIGSCGGIFHVSSVNAPKGLQNLRGVAGFGAMERNPANRVDV